MTFRTLAASAALMIATAVPALAQGTGPGPTIAPHERVHVHRQHQGTGFWPVDAAGGIVGGAIGTAGAIAAAPFGQGPYASYYGYGQPYGFTCQPGTRFRGDDGRVHLCQ